MNSLKITIKQLNQNFWKLLIYIIMIGCICVFELSFSATIEEDIRTGRTSTAALIVADHPRIWVKGNWDWDYNNYGSFAWRVCHGEQLHKDDPANDQEKHEFYYTVCSAGDFSADYMIGTGQVGHTTYGRRVLEHIWAGISRKYNWWDFLPKQLIGSSGTFEPDYTWDQYFTYAREKLLGILEPTVYWTKAYTIIYGSVAYDWLYNETYEDGTPVLSQSDKTTIQNALIGLADEMKSLIDGSDELFQSGDISKYFYPIVGMALYEPSGQGISIQNNMKAKAYLDDFDTFWVGKILPALNEQGGDGGWHGGISNVFNVISWFGIPYDRLLPVLIVPVLFAHYTATGESFENSVFSTGVLKYHAEFQNYMIRPSTSGYYGGEYYNIGIQRTNRGPWVFQMRTYARRRFSSDPEQRRIAELGNWVARNFRTQYTQAGSWCMVDQTMFEDKWESPRSPEELGYGTKHFQKLGWIFMRESFTSPEDLAALFICQRYHWSHLDPYAQNSFTLEYKGELIEGNNNTLFIDSQGQRTISEFPTISQGVEAYAPGSTYDVGPGILKFETQKKYDYIFGDATNAYDRNKLQKFTRQIVFLKPDKFVILDHVVTTEQNYSKSWVIDPGATPQIIGNNFVVIKNGSGALWLKRLLPETVIIENLTSERYQITPNQANYEDFFLHVLQTTNSTLSENSPEVIVDEASSQVSDDTLSVKIGDWEVLFQASGDTGIWVRKSEEQVGDFGISGRVEYYSTGDGVRNTNVNLTNGITESKTSDENGSYEFLNLGNNVSYVVTSEKTEDIPLSTILTYDASQAAQIVFNILPDISENQRRAADVDQDGNVYMYDASMIARHAVGLDPLPGTKVGAWQFTPPQQTILSLNSNIEDANFTATVLGDVDGNWSPSNILKKEQIAKNTYPLSGTWKKNGASFIIPFISEKNKEIYSYDISLTYDPKILSYEQTKTAPIYKNFNNQINNSEIGKIRIGAYGIKSVKHYGILLEIIFEVIGGKGESCEIELERFHINNENSKYGKAIFTVGSEQKMSPDKFVLYQNYPNPFNPQTNIQYILSAETHVSLVVYNIQGQQIKTLYDAIQKPGIFNVKWNGEDDNGGKLTSGVYIYKLKTKDFTATKKMLLFR
jgi:hypothetical protein